MASYFVMRCFPLLCVLTASVLGSHFRGGVIMVRSKSGGELNEMEVFFHVSWRLSYAPEGYCDQSVVDSGILIGSGDLVCQHGCSNTTVISSMAYRCTDFSFEEDWTFGEHQFTHIFDGSPTITIGFTGEDWLDPFEAEWNISTTFSITKRNDTGSINSSPRAISSPLLRLQAGCNHIIRIPVYDPDNDIVRCRWATGTECAGICGGFPGAELDSESCSITYRSNLGVGHRAVAIVIEDYLPESTDPMSSVGLQFLVLVFSSTRPCSVAPEFIPPTINDGSCVAIPPGGTFHTMLVAVSGIADDAITEIQTVSPEGMEKSELFHDDSSNIFYVNITWTPTTDQENDIHMFCFTATNSAGLSTSQICIDLLPGHRAPVPIPGTAAPNMVSVHPSDTTWSVNFNIDIERPSTTAYITFHEFDTDVVVHRIDTSSSSEVVFENGNRIALTTDHVFSEKRDFYINFERGAVVGLDGCGPGNEPITGKRFWTFETLDVTPPNIHFLNNPSVSNVNISITWEGNEEVSWQCLLNTGLETLVQECSNGFWNGYNLLGGVYSLEVSGTDVANNTATVVHTFTVDVTPPIVLITRAPSAVSNQKTTIFRFRCEEFCTYQCQFHGASYTTTATSFPCTSGQYRTPILTHGESFIFTVTATDQVGNIAEPISYTWKTDFEAPIVFGVMNTSIPCTSDLSPTYAGQAQAVDNTSSIVGVTFIDRRMTCSIARTWRATDSAGNVGLLTQYITLEFTAALSFVPQVSVSCDSSRTSVSVPTNTATLHNPCRRPMRLHFAESVSEYMCPDTFTRTWTITDDCNQETSLFEQTISLYDVCPADACGRSESPPRGICIQGGCRCNEPWYGDNCSTLIHSIQVEPVNDSVLQELEDYSTILTVIQGTPPLIITLISSPNRMVLSQETRDITWRRAQAGNYSVTVEFENQVSRERVSWLLSVKPGYTASLDQVLENVFPRATAVELNGHIMYIEGNKVQELLGGFVPVTIEISSRNGRRELTVFSRHDGTFSAIFYPASTEYGSYVAGARHPRVLRATEQTSWDFLGMTATPRRVRLRDSTVAEYEQTFHNVSIITNDGPQTLHDITVASSFDNNDDLSIMVRLTGHSTLEPGDSAYIDIRVEAKGALEASFSIAVESVEGVTLFLLVDLKIAQILPQLVADPASINTRVVRGIFRNLDINITNVGTIPAHMVRAVLPMSEFLSLISFGNALQQTEGELTLGSGESAALSVLVTVPAEQPLGDITGQIVISSLETFRVIHFNLLVSSNILMNLTVVVEDEYTYFAEGSPLLSNAVVRLVNNKRSIRETLTTEESGTVTFFNIPEDRYELFITGPNHVPMNQIIVTSAEEPVYTVFLARTAVSYSFTVVPTTFDETYTVTLEADFETHVPIPVVTITPRDLSLEPYELGLEDTIQYNITNHGLIRTDNVTFELPDGHPFLEFSTDITDIGSLDALTSIIIPVKVTRVEGREKRNVASCVSALFYAVGITYSYVCGTLQTRSASAVLRGFAHFSNCGGGNGVSGGGGGGGGVYRVVSLGGGSAHTFVHDASYTPTTINCDKCITSAVGCLPIPFRLFNCFHFAFSVAMSIYTSGITRAFNFFDLADHTGWISCYHSLRPINLLRGIAPVLCLPGVLRDCFGVQTAFNFDRKRRSLRSTVQDTVLSYYAMHQFTLLGVEILGDERWVRLVNDPTWLRETLSPVLSDTSDGGPLITNSEFNFITSIPPPQNATQEMVETVLERLNNTFYGWNNGILEPENGTNIVSYATTQNLTNDIRRANERIVEGGHPSFIESYNDVVDQFNMIENFDEAGICAVVRIRIEQEIALTREAFLARLEIENMEASSLEQVQLEFLITNVNSALDATHLFSISNVTLTGSLTSGEDGWSLLSAESGAAEWLIVPLSEAAPTENQDYNVGGTLSYIANGENISAPLLPTRITVAPDPSLIVHYFWEKFVIGDNPFTDEREPSVPFALAVAIHNAGYGVAMNLRITSGQPEIIENEKGLLVTFKIIGASIGSETVTPSLSVHFGDIPAMTTKVARWWMISSLQGEFMNYSASFEYMNPLGDPRLSVLDELVIHDLIRNVQVYNEGEDDGVLDFLVNDRRDLFNIPDALYSSKTFTRYNVSSGDVESVGRTGSGLLDVHVVSNYSGWVYFRYEDTQNVFSETKRSINVTKSVNNESITLPPENSWITREPSYQFENVLPFFLHIIDYIEEAAEIIYTLNPCTSDCPTNERPFERPTPPVPPINVKAKAVGSTWITLSWEQVPTSTVVVNQTVIISGGGTTHNVTVDGGQSILNVTELLSGVTYTLQVVAVAEDGQMSFPSVSITAMTFFSFAPSAPVNLSLDSFGESWVAFLWFQIPSEIDIISHIVSVSGGGMEWDITIDGDQSTVNVTDLLPEIEYEFKITAVASDGQMSSQSAALVATTRSTVLGPSSPQNVVFKSISATWISISWDNGSANADIVSYTVTAASGSGSVSITVDGNNTDVNVTGLKPGTEYTLTVVSISAAGDMSSPSDPLIIMTLGIPEFIPPTPEDDSCVEIPPGGTFHTMLVAVSGSADDNITKIQTVSPEGMESTDLFTDTASHIFYISISWTPTTEQENIIHLFCYRATNSAGLSTSQICIDLLPGHRAPAPIPETAAPNMVSVHPSGTTWSVNFDRDIERPSTTAYITFHEFDTDVVVHRIDTSSSSEIVFENGNGIVLTTDCVFSEKREFYINFERGAVVSLDGCGPGNEPITGKQFWTFETLDVTPPIIHFLNNPSVSNVNISITWEGNEEVTWQCLLNTGLATLVQECSTGFWNGYNLLGGVYSLEVSGRDTANNTASVVHIFTIDALPPIVSITGTPPAVSNQETALFQFTCDDICPLFQCWFHEDIDKVGFVPCNSGRYVTPSLSHGKHYVFSVSATDQVGNIAEPISYTWKTDFEAPIVFGVMNTSIPCTGDLSPSHTGQAQAVDNTTSIVGVTFIDRRMTCSIVRTWRASDSAGNVGLLTQYITLDYSAVLNFLPQISMSCDSFGSPLLVPTNTATLQNPCGRPLRLHFAESVSEYMCPDTFTRTWTITDDCNQETSLFEQTISLYNVCPADACGRSESPPHGICVQGGCICNEPWYGDNCSTLIHSIQVEPVNDSVLQELEDYSTTLTVVQGTPPLIYTLMSGPDRIVLSRSTGDITWRRAQAGNYSVTVEVENQVSGERVSWLLSVKPGYAASLDQVSENVFPRATAVELNGHIMYIEGNKVQELLGGFVPVTIEISSRNGRRELTVFSRQDGTFSATFYPASTEYGSYAAGAKHPRVLRATEQTSWDFLGMTATPRRVRLRDSTLAEYEQTFHNVSIITNDGPQTLHDITVVSSFDNNDDLSIMVRLTGHSTLEPGNSAYIDIRAEAKGALEATFSIAMESAEGVTLILSVNLKIVQILPQLVADPASINTRVVRGIFRNIDINITNVGTIPAHMVRAVLPMSEFLSLISFGNALQQTEGELTLGSGESAALSVLVTVPAEQPLGDITGQIVISSVETFRVIRFNLLVSSNILMNLTVVVEDEYTYFAEGLPLLSNAIVRLINNKRGIRETITTGESGTTIFINIPEDQYELRVSGPNHVPVNQIIVTSAEEPVYTVFLARRAVSYSFTVVPTTFDETYTVTLEADFMTHVPIPVVTITPRDLSLEPYELGLEDTIQYNITNHGLIRADDVEFELPDGHPFLEFSTDIEIIGSLDALTSIIIPVKVTRVEGRERRNVASCVSALIYAVGTAYSYVCGYIQHRTAYAALKSGLAQFSDCDLGGGGGNGGTYRVISRRNGISGPFLHDTTYTPTHINCDKCINSALGCLPNPIPYFSCIKLATSVFTHIKRSGFSVNGIVRQTGWLDCLIDILPPMFSKPISLARCLYNLLKDCVPTRERRSLQNIVQDAVQSFYAMHQLASLGVEVLGDERWLRLVKDPNWLRETLHPVLSDASDGGPLITNAEFSHVLNNSLPHNATRDMVKALLERLNNTFHGWNNGILEPENGTNIVSYSTAQNLTSDINMINERIVMSENETFLDSYNDVAEQFNMVEDFSEEEGVCAVVRIRIEQEIALTRDAFLATLEIENKEISDLEQVQLEFLITNVNSALDATHLFSLSNVTLTGSLTSSEDGWSLQSGESGAGEWLIVPLSEAAPTENQDYNIGGRLSYTANGENISVPLLPTRITVAPDPSLIIHYFWEKFVIGDNPFTEEREPSVPFALAVAIHNAGYGVAMNLRITSGQPEIIENEKGLQVTFKIIGASIGSESVTPSLSVDFGDIPAMTTKVARWWMISSLQGEFMNYSANFEYMNPLGDPRLSVLDELVIHDLIRNVQVYNEGEDDGVLDFLVNDRRDLFNIPDALYSSKTFTRYNVSTGDVESVGRTGSGLLEVHVVSNYSGWVYFGYEDTQNIFSETKRSINFTKSMDNRIIDIPPENAWVTRELQKNPGDILSFSLHIIDYIDEIGEIIYTLNPCTSDCPTNERPFERATPPVPPINVKAKAVGSTWITLSWEQVPTSTVVVNQTVIISGGGTTHNVTVDGGQSILNVTELLSGVTYTLQVVAVAEDGQMSFPSVPITAMTFFSFAPSAPVNLSLDSFGESWVAFLWFQIPSEIDIVSQIVSVSGGGMEWNITIDGDQSTVNVTDLLPEIEYEFRITAVASDGQMSSQSAALVATTRSTVLGPSSPQNVVYESNGGTWIVISWDTPLMNADIAGYIVTAVSDNGSVSIMVDGSTTEVNITELIPGTEYTLTVVSVSISGDMSSPSNPLVVKTAPVAPSKLEVTSVGISWIVLSWQQYSGTQEVVRQEVYVVGGGERRVLVVPGVERMVNVTGLEPGTEYTFNIRSEGADGQKSLLSESIRAFTLIPVLDLFFINDTPRLHGGMRGSILAHFTTNRQNIQIRCRLRGFERQHEDCSTGTFSRANVPPGRYVLRIEARDLSSSETNVMATVIELDASEGYCTTYLINRGLRVEGQTLTVEFTSTGQFDGFTCILNRQRSLCSNPLVIHDMSPGRYAIKILPQGCDHFQPWKKVFNIE